MIDSKEWGNFRIGDIFEVSRPAERSIKKYEMGNTPFVASGRFNNGIVAYLEKKTDDDFEKGNCITVSPVDGYAFYQEKPFLGRGGAGSSIIILRNDNLNESRGLFVCTIIRVTCASWVYSDMGGEQALKDLVIKLPVTPKGIPDWEYMDLLIKCFIDESECRLRRLEKVSPTRKAVCVELWSDYRIGDLFNKLDLNCRKLNFNKALDCSESPNEEFSLPLVNAKHFNNGIQFYGRPDEWDSAEMTIDIVSNGAIATGDVYAQPQRTGVLWDAYLIKCVYEIKSEYILHFLACVIEKCIKQYFGWNDKCTWEKVKEKKIKLPTTSEGNPDWDYMDSYMKQIMEESEKRIDFLQNTL